MSVARYNQRLWTSENGWRLGQLALYLKHLRGLIRGPHCVFCETCVRDWHRLHLLVCSAKSVIVWIAVICAQKNLYRHLLFRCVQSRAFTLMDAFACVVVFAYCNQIAKRLFFECAIGLMVLAGFGQGEWWAAFCGYRAIVSASQCCIPLGKKKWLARR